MKGNLHDYDYIMTINCCIIIYIADEVEAEQKRMKKHFAYSSDEDLSFLKYALAQTPISVNMFIIKTLVCIPSTSEHLSVWDITWLSGIQCHLPKCHFKKSDILHILLITVALD